MELDINDVLDRLKNVKKCGTGYSACCPAHDDRTPSLSVKEEGGKLLMYCHKGCDFVQIVQSLGLFEPEQNERKKKEVAVYDYFDENGELRYQVVRYEPKTFRLRKPDGKGGWEWNLKDTRRVIYNLPEILQAREDDYYVVFCEGEKDADNVKNKLNLPATTVATGANAWRESYADSFFGLNVVILPDNDEVGKEFAKKVANSISNQAQSVRVINLPDLPESGDVSDWIEKGGTREQLIELIETTTEWQFKNEANENEKKAVDNKNDDLLIIKPAGEWIEEAKTKPIPKMLFGELWFEDEICLLFADTNVGKSILAVQIADSITKGKAINHFALETAPQKVLYFDFELNDRQFSNRYGENKNGFLANEYQFNKDFLRVALNPSTNYLWISDYEEYLVSQIQQAIIQTGIKVIIVDNITYLKNNNERAKDALPLMQKLKALKEKHKLSILALAHTPKRDLYREITQNDIAGSKMLINFCDSAFAMSKSTNGEDIRYMKQIKERNTSKVYGRDNVCVAEINKPDNFLSLNFFAFGKEKDHLADKTKQDKEMLIQQVVDLKAQGQTHKMVASTLGIGYGSVTNHLRDAEELGITPSSKVQDVQDVQNAHPLFNVNNVNDVNKAEKVEEIEMERINIEDVLDLPE